MWEILLNNADWDCLKILTLREILKIQNPLLEEHYVHFRKSYICSNQLDVQETNFSFAQFNRIRNHFFGCTGLRLDGIPALDLWDLIVAVLHGNAYHNNQARSPPHTIHKRKQSQRVINDLDNVDFFPQTSNLLIRKLCCMCLKTTKQWSR